MTDFLSLDEDTRAHALVGSFLQAWSHMEGELDLTIAEALEISPLVGSLLGKNIQFGAKIKILRELVSISALMDSEKLRISKRLKKLGEYASYRNMIAHDPFAPSETSDGVVFVLGRSKGRQLFPINDWSVAKFQEIDEDIGKFSDELESLRDNLNISRAAMKEWASRFYAGDPVSQ